MQCAEFDVCFDQLLDERRAWQDDARLAAHAEACPRCGQIVAAWDLVAAAVECRQGAMADPAAAGLNEADLTAADNHSMANTLASHRPRSPYLALGGLAAAAVLGWLIVGRPMANPRSDETPSQPAAVERMVIDGLPAALPGHAETARDETPLPGAAVAVEPVWAARGSSRESDTEALSAVSHGSRTEREPLVDLARETGRGLAVIVFHLPGVGLQSMSATQAWGSPADDWQNRMPSGLQPWTQPMTEALKSFWEGRWQNEPAADEPSPQTS